MKKGISVVVPFLNEEDGIAACCKKFDEYRSTVDFPIELIFVNDGSTDKTVEYLKNYKFVCIEKAKIISLSKNFGSHAAIRAGLRECSYDSATWIGADIQEPLELIKIGLEKILDGFDMACIEKEEVKVSFFNRLFSKTYSALMRKYAVENYASGGISTIVMNKKILDVVNENIESNSSIMLQLLNLGFSQCIIPMKFNKRDSGVSKWTLKKKIKLFIDSFVGFSSMPIRAVSIIGIIMFILGVLFGLSVIINKIISPDMPVMGYPTLACLLSMGFGITNISLGIIAEYLWRTYDASMARPVFIVSEIIEVK